jgi:hypothetical protein
VNLPTMMRRVGSQPTAEEERAAARKEERRQRLVAIAMRSAWEELPRRELEFGRRDVTHTPTGECYRLYRGEVDAQYSPVVAYFVTESGDPVFLERR